MASATAVSLPQSSVSPRTAAFLLDMLNRQQLQVGAPDFDQAVALIQEATSDLRRVIENAAA